MPVILFDGTKHLSFALLYHIIAEHEILHARQSFPNITSWQWPVMKMLISVLFHTYAVSFTRFSHDLCQQEAIALLSVEGGFFLMHVISRSRFMAVCTQDWCWLGFLIQTFIQLKLIRCAKWPFKSVLWCKVEYQQHTIGQQQCMFFFFVIFI